MSPSSPSTREILKLNNNNKIGNIIIVLCPSYFLGVLLFLSFRKLYSMLCRIKEGKWVKANYFGINCTQKRFDNLYNICVKSNYVPLGDLVWSFHCIWTFSVSRPSDQESSREIIDRLNIRSNIQILLCQNILHTSHVLSNRTPFWMPLGVK